MINDLSESADFQKLLSRAGWLNHTDAKEGNFRIFSPAR